jgi:rhodanese-related sulfurtransferase
MFLAAEQLERIYGKQDPKKAPKWRYAAAGTLVLGAIALIFIGQPTSAERWDRISAEKQALLDQRAVQIHPGELLDLTADNQIKVVMLDVRSEADFNIFHILDARHVPLEELPNIVSDLHFEPENTVFVTISNDETAATEAWKFMVAESVPNVYILEGGINNWIALFGDDDLTKTLNRGAGDDQLCYIFDSALGARNPAAEPDPESMELEYIPKVKLELKRAPTSGGCG